MYEPYLQNACPANFTQCSRIFLYRCVQNLHIIGTYTGVLRCPLIPLTRLFRTVLSGSWGIQNCSSNRNSEGEKKKYDQPKLTNKRCLMVCHLEVLRSAPEKLRSNYRYYFTLLRTVLGKQVREITVGRQTCKPRCSSQEYKLIPLTDMQLARVAPSCLGWHAVPVHSVLTLNWSLRQETPHTPRVMAQTQKARRSTTAGVRAL